MKGVFDRTEWLTEFSKSRDMTGDTTSNNPWSPPAPVFSDSVESPWGPKMLHHKYMLIDSDFDSSAIVIAGSQNWSNNGEIRNDENTLIIHSQDMANQYLQEFVERYREAGGEYVGCSEEKKKVIREHKIQVFPNPFFNSLKIRGCLKTRIYDISGRFVVEVEDEWDGKNSEGKEVNAGVYFLRSNRLEIEKVVKLR